MIAVRWRALKFLVVLATGGLVAAACGEGAEPPDDGFVEVLRVPAAAARELDLLFVVDDAPGTDQLPLARAMPQFVDALFLAVPNLHAGVITTDLGATGSADAENPRPAIGIPGGGGCFGQGGDGRIREGFGVDGTFLVDEDDGMGGRTRNYLQGGLLSDQLGQMMFTGGSGCLFAQPFAAVHRALLPVINPGFLRPDAALAIVHFGPADDCSIRNPDFFDEDEDSPLGPVLPFRCTRFGVECDELIDYPGAKHGCRPRVGSPYLEDVDQTIGFLRGLKADPSRVTVSAIAGPHFPFVVELSHGTSAGFQPELLPSCTWDASSADNTALPPVRIASLVHAFGSAGTLSSICEPELERQVERVATVINRSLGVACFDPARLGDTSPEPGVQPACEALDVIGDTTLPVPHALVADDDACAPGLLRMQLARTGPAPVGAHVQLRCRSR